jgi:hypothetical protein
MSLYKHPLLTVCLAGLLALATVNARAAGKAIPEFGPSVEFDSAGPQPALSKLKGKAVIILFFQSSCPICNKWAPAFFKDVQNEYGTNNAVVLIALKTDGGGIAGAKTYLKSKGVNLDQWIVGSDDGAKYHTQVTGDDSLWCYTLLGADGTIVQQAKAGMSKRFGPDKVTLYNLADPALLKKCGKLTTVLPPDKRYDPSLSSLVRMAEFGDAEKALVLCSAAISKMNTRQAATELKADLQPVVEKRLSDRAALLGDATQPSPARYDAFQELTRMVSDLKTLPAATKVVPVLTRAKQDPALQKEARAESAYRGLQTRVQKAGDRDKPRLVKELETFAQQAAGTKYGQLAVESAKQLSDSIPTDTK